MAVHYADPLASKIKLRGECSKCGLCCVGTAPDGVGWHCEFLMVTPTVPLGLPEATKCGVYERRWNGMPIRLVRNDATMVAGVCFKNCWEETHQILPHIGKGCSLTMALDT